MNRAFLSASRSTGLFTLCRTLTRRGLRILCYHGFGAGDEVQFLPGLFITPATFRRRLETLRDGGYPVLTLSAALRGLDGGDLPDCATVITVDDVFPSFQRDALPLLREFEMPVTAYVTTYYSVKRHPVFRLVIQYMFWKTAQTSVELRDIHPSLEGNCILAGAQSRQDAAWQVIPLGESQLDEDQRVALATRIGEVLGVDFDRIRTERTFDIVTAEEIRALAAQGVDVQLHTHRHRLPPDAVEVRREVEDNRRVLEPLTGKQLEHLCYPSGEWSQDLWAPLAEVGVASATTCDAGLNYPETPRLALRRILDAEDVPHEAFEAELTGFKHLLRRARAAVR